MTKAKGPNRYGSEIWFKEDHNRWDKRQKRLAQKREQRQRGWERDSW